MCIAVCEICDRTIACLVANGEQVLLKCEECSEKNLVKTCQEENFSSLSGMYPIIRTTILQTAVMS